MSRLYRRLGSDGLKFTTLLQVRWGSRTTTALDSRLRGNDECVLDRHCAAGFGASVVGDVSGQCTDHLAAESIDELVDLLLVVHLFVLPCGIEGNVVVFQRRLDDVEGVIHEVGVRRVVCIRVTERHSHVSGSPLSEGDARDGGGLLGER